MRLLLPLALTVTLTAQTGAAPAHHAAGPFEATTTPIAASGSNPQPGRLALDKHYHGALEGTGAGEMLTGGDYKTGSAGYVALETVTGTLHGAAGTFQLMHWGVMSGGNLDLRVAVVPGSGTGALSGITGEMKITIAPDGKHTYDLSYSLPIPGK